MIPLSVAAGESTVVVPQKQWLVPKLRHMEGTDFSKLFAGTVGVDKVHRDKKPPGAVAQGPRCRFAVGR